MMDEVIDASSFHEGGRTCCSVRRPTFDLGSNQCVISCPANFNIGSVSTPDRFHTFECD